MTLLKRVRFKTVRTWRYYLLMPMITALNALVKSISGGPIVKIKCNGKVIANIYAVIEADVSAKSEEIAQYNDRK